MCHQVSRDNKPANVLYLTDKQSGKRFLIDTGTGLSVLPAEVSPAEGKKVYSKIDLKDAFLQIPVHPDDVPKTTITTPFGAFQCHYKPFGFRGASQSFQRFIDTAL